MGTALGRRRIFTENPWEAVKIGQQSNKRAVPKSCIYKIRAPNSALNIGWGFQTSLPSSRLLFLRFGTTQTPQMSPNYSRSQRRSPPGVTDPTVGFGVKIQKSCLIQTNPVLSLQLITPSEFTFPVLFCLFIFDPSV